MTLRRAARSGREEAPGRTGDLHGRGAAEPAEADLDRAMARFQEPDLSIGAQS